MKKFTIFLLLLIFYTPVAFAIESSPSAETKSKLEELKQQIASKAALLKQLIDQKLTNKAYVGKVKTKSTTSITLASKNGPRIVNINQDTEFISQVKGLPAGRQGKKYSQKLVSEEDYVAALGDVDENQVLTTKRLILLPNVEDNQKTHLWGQIVSKSDKLVIIKTRDLKNVSVSLDQKVNLNNFVILSGSMDKNNIFQADFVYTIPQGGFIKPKKPRLPDGQVATPSPQIATKSATPKPISR